MSIGKKIKELRNLNKLTQVELAKKSNISRSYLADLEKDRYNASLDTLKSIAKALDVSINIFFDDAAEKESKDYLFEQYLGKLGFEIILDDVKDHLILDIEDSQYEISTDDLDDFQDNIESFIKFKISELINKLKKPSTKINTDIPIAAHNDFENDIEEQKLMKEDIDDL